MPTKWNKILQNIMEIIWRFSFNKNPVALKIHDYLHLWRVNLRCKTHEQLCIDVIDNYAAFSIVSVFCSEYPISMDLKETLLSIPSTQNCSSFFSLKCIHWFKTIFLRRRTKLELLITGILQTLQTLSLS